MMLDALSAAVGCGVFAGWLLSEAILRDAPLRLRSFSYWINLSMAFVAGMLLVYAWWVQDSLGSVILAAAIGSITGVAIGITIDIWTMTRVGEANNGQDTRG